MTQELQSDLLGRVENDDGIVFIGSETQPPYAGIYSMPFSIAI